MRDARRVRVALTLVVVIAVVAVAGCGAGAASSRVAAAPSAVAAAGFPLTLTDDASRTVTLKSAALRVVSLAPANTEIVYALAPERLVGVTTWDDYPAAVTTLPKVGDFTTPNLEAIASAKPDLVLVTGGVQADVLGKIEGLGASVLVIDPKGLDGVYRSIGLVGDAMGLRAKAATLTDSMRAEIAGVRERVSSAEPVTCFVEIGWNPLWTTGEGTLVDDMVRAAGGLNVVKEPGYVGYSTEQLLRDQPAAYLATRTSIGETSTLSQRPGYARLGAVTAGRVYALDDNLVSRPGPRVGQGIAEIARALHPGRF